MSWSHNHAALITKCYSLPTAKIKHSTYMTPKMCCLLYIFSYLVQCCCHFLTFLGGTDLDLLIAITLNRSIIIPMLWYCNHYKYLPIHKMITVINTSDKRKNTEKFQNHQLRPCASLSFSMFSMHKSSNYNYLFFPSFSLSSRYAPLPINSHVSIRKDMEIFHIYLQCFPTKLDLLS